jgi:hypothetical protein
MAASAAVHCCTVPTSENTAITVLALLQYERCCSRSCCSCTVTVSALTAHACICRYCCMSCRSMRLLDSSSGSSSGSSSVCCCTCFSTSCTLHQCLACVTAAQLCSANLSAQRKYSPRPLLLSSRSAASAHSTSRSITCMQLRFASASSSPCMPPTLMGTAAQALVKLGSSSDAKQ